eukprot:m.7075 g.7075  ORF g.7075 m.7075 type:complete len:581 (-) comp3644_c0_seq1:144-1886(-)
MTPSQNQGGGLRDKVKYDPRLWALAATQVVSWIVVVALMFSTARSLSNFESIAWAEVNAPNHTVYLSLARVGMKNDTSSEEKEFKYDEVNCNTYLDALEDGTEACEECDDALDAAAVFIRLSLFVATVSLVLCLCRNLEGYDIPKVHIAVCLALLGVCLCLLIGTVVFTESCFKELPRGSSLGPAFFIAVVLIFWNFMAFVVSLALFPKATHTQKKSTTHRPSTNLRYYNGEQEEEEEEFEMEDANGYFHNYDQNYQGIRPSSPLQQVFEVQDLDAMGPAGVSQVLESIDTFMFDCDGVIWRGDGLIECAAEVIQMLERLNKQIIFITNNATKTISGMKRKFEKFNINVKTEWLVTSLLVAEQYLLRHNMVGKVVYCLGTADLHATLQKHGIITNGLDDADYTFEDCSKIAEQVAKLKSVSAVLVGFDPKFNYFKVAKAVYILKMFPNAKFIATNTDSYSPLLPDRTLVPGNGMSVAAIERSSCRKAEIVGKPSKELAKYIFDRYSINPERALMTGDRPDTDILWGKRCGVKTLLVASGVTSCEEAAEIMDALDGPKLKLRPTYVSLSVASLLRGDESTA